MCLWCFCLLLLPLLRPDSPPLLDKVGLTGEPGAPWVLRLEVQVCLPLFSAHVKDRCRAGPTEPADRHLQTSQRVTHLEPSPPSSLVAFNILIYCWQVIESHCFWGCEEKRGYSWNRWHLSPRERAGHAGTVLNGLHIRAHTSARGAQVFVGPSLISLQGDVLKRALVM